MFKMAMRYALARASRRPQGAQLLKPLAIASCAQPPPRPFRRCISTAQSEAATPKPAVKFSSETYPSLKRDSRFAQLTADHVNHFKRLLGTDAVLDAATDPSASDEVDGFNTDWMRKYRGHGKLVLKPNSTVQVSQILGYCNQQKLAVVPQGGNTGLVGGSVPVFDEIVINLSRMNKVRHFDDVSGILVADAGCILEAVDHYLAERGYIFPLDLGSKGSCQIGGNVSTNAGGLRLLRYGSLHGSVLGLEVVLPDGRIMNDLIKLRKNNTGYDLKQLFIGAEGTIGIVTAVSIHCPQRPRAVNVAFLGLQSYDKAQQAFREAKGQLSEILSAFELLDGRSQELVAEVTKNRQPLDGKHPFYCLIETSGSNSEHDSAKLEAFLESVMEKEIVSDGVVAQDQTQVKALWAWREGVPECAGHWGGVYKYDVSIPLKDMYQLVEDTEWRVRDARLLGDTDDHPVIAVVGYGHMGDANLHLNIVVRRYDKKVERVLEPWVYDWIEDHEGSISAEHGLGLAKKKYIDYTRKGTVVHMMKEVKQLYDPNGIMNPYKYI